jgi:hypothetical protein
MMRSRAAPTLIEKFRRADREYAVSLVHSVCCLAGDPEFLQNRGTGGKNSLTAAVERHDTARLFDWLVEALSYQGIADRIAHDYMQRQAGRAGPASRRALLVIRLARSSTAIGSSNGAVFKKVPRPAPSPRTSPPVPCQPCRCATVISIKWPTACFCSFAMLPVAIS